MPYGQISGVGAIFKGRVPEVSGVARIGRLFAELHGLFAQVEAGFPQVGSKRGHESLDDLQN